MLSLRIDDNKLLEKYKTIWTKIEDLKNIELDALPIHDDRDIKIKIRIYGDEVHTNELHHMVMKFIRGLNVPEDDVECGSFAGISTDSLLVYENKN